MRNRLNAAWAGWPLRSKGLVVIAIPLGALLAGLVCFFLLGKAEDRQETSVSHTIEVRSELHQLFIHLVGAETGMRGFLLTRREEFLEPYHAGLKALPESLSRVSDLIKDPRQAARLRTVNSLVVKRMEILTRVMETAAAEPALPSARTTAGLLEGKATMDALRQELDRMDQEEARLMDARVAALERVRNWSLAAFVASGLFGVLGGVAAMFIFSKGVVLRTRALEENTRRLAEETPLLPAPTRSDEIGRLEQGVQAASRLLAARGDALRAETARLSAEVAERTLAEKALRESEGRYRSLFDGSLDAIFSLGADGRFVTANPAALRLAGRTIEEVKALHFLDLCAPDQRAAAAEAFRAAFCRQCLTLEVAVIAGDGTRRELFISGAPAIVGGEVVGVSCIGRDVTERARAAAALRESEERWRYALEVSELGAWELNLVDHTAWRSLRHDQIFGYAELLPEWTFEVFLQHVLEEDRPGTEGSFKRAMAEHTDWSFECRIRRADGPVRWIWAYGKSINDADGRPVRMFGLVSDITVRKEAEEALRASEGFNRSIIESSPDCIKVLDLEGNLLSMLSGQELLGIEDIQPFLNKSWIEFWEGADDCAAARAAVATAAAGEEGHFVGFFRTLRGEDKWWDVAITPILGTDGQPSRLLAVSRDVVQRHQAEEVLRQSAAQFETLVNEAPLGVLLIDADFRIRQVNPTALPAYGNIPDLIGRDYAEILHVLWPKAQADEAVKQFRHTLETGEPCFVPEMIEQRADRQATEYYEWQINRIPLPDGRHGVVCYFRDISERVLAQQEIRESEERYRSLFNSMDEGFCIIEMILDESQKPVDWRYLEVNPSFVTLTGIHNIVGTRIRELVPDHEEYWFEIYGKVILTGEPIRFVNEAKGLGRWFDLYAFRVGGPGRLKVAVLFTNITERKKAAELLTVSLHEKEVLLREVHHRVKNNLQIVSSLLNLQSRTLTDPALLQVFASTRNRVRAMAAVHERLYESGDFAQIDLAAHLGKLARTLTLAHAPTGMTVQPVLQLDPVTVDLNTAVPLSLIASELITNALKYGFAEGRTGTLTIGLRAGGGHHELRIGDDGPGFPAAVDPATTRTLGLRLVRDLSRQIRGEMEIDSTAAGTNVVVRWPARLAVSEPAEPPSRNDAVGEIPLSTQRRGGAEGAEILSP